MSKQATPPPPGDKPGPGAPPPPTPPRWRHWVWLGAIVVAIILWYFLPAVHQAGQTTLNYTQFTADVTAHKVATITISPTAGGTSTGTLTDKTNFSVVFPAQVGQQTIDQMVAAGVKVTGGSSSAGFG